MEAHWKEKIDEEVKALQQARDELRVQIHLGAAEAHETWQKIEKSWEHLESHVKRIGQATHESAEDVEDAAKLLLDEIKLGYDRIRSAL